MRLSVATFLLFLFLLPGLVFRFALYQKSVVRRAVDASNTIHSILAVVFFAVVTNISLFLLLTLSGSICDAFDFRIGYENEFLIVRGETKEELYSFVVNRPLYPIGYTVSCSIWAWTLARFFNWLGRRWEYAGRLIFGPLSPLLQTKKEFILTCFVLSKISHENRRMIYAGELREIGLRDGSKIDYVVLDSPMKFFLRINREWPTTSFDKSRPIKGSAAAYGMLFVSSDQIENVHIEAWYVENNEEEII